MSNKQPYLFIFCALHCEAKPLIQYYQLKKINRHKAFEVYQNNEMILAISGVGKVSMAAAVAYLMAINPEVDSPILINIGIAGHQYKAIGELYLAERIFCEDEPNRQFYPQIIGNIALQSDSVKTVNAPNPHYPSEELYDMEAGAFFPIACKFSSAELIHSLKIISDNQQQGVKEINGKKVSRWIAAKIDMIAIFIEELRGLREQIPQNDQQLYLEIIQLFHFTVSNRVKLKSLLQQWQVISNQQPLNYHAADFNHAAELLAWLERKIKSQTIHL